ncbi:MAG TPA: YdeI/OmpD-associated family protein [Ignavibacteria bacterium]|nr:YdeI/OmpD-associated family protein [Ignavibacteria bacterium]
MSKKSFTIKLLKVPDYESAYFNVPFDVQKEYGTKARVFVKGTIDGVPYRTSIAPMGGGKHFFGLNKEMRAAIGKSYGDTVKVTMEIDRGERVVEIPKDLLAALKSKPAIKKIFDGYAYTHRREFSNWITSAKKPETRQRRILQALEKISKNEKLS